jgi:hypothetical protein
VQTTKAPRQVEVDEAFSIRRETELPRVATLCHMVGGAQSDDACDRATSKKYHNRTKPETSRLSPVFLTEEKCGRDFRLMLASHERELAAAKGRGEPAGQIAARGLEVARIRSAVRRVEELTCDIAEAIETA